MFQSGDVDYLIATDAIGMGLNLDLDHVAFAQNRKFDGYQYRNLTAAELGQIAGRAGRHLRDGTFGVTGQVDPLDEDLVKKIEGHDFEPVKVLQWRTAHFDFASLDALKRSIETNAPVEGLTRALPAVDAQALEYLYRDEDIRARATDAKRVALLWEACALPDYRKIAPAQHSDLIASMFTDLARLGHVDENYMAEQVQRADSTDGDIDTLSHRIAQIRTWTFVSNRPGWLADPAHWQEKTREIEDRLSDALHERLTKRFVDRRTSVLMRRLRENTMSEAEISPAGAVLVEGHHVGELQGFRFTADQSAGGEDAKAVKAAAQKALAAEYEARADRFGACANGDIALAKGQTSNEVIAWSNGEGTYIPTPIFYDGILYTFGNNGVVTAYDGASGERLYRARVGNGGAFSASPIAADGRLYFASEDGDIFVARAGRAYQEIAKNEMKEVIMSTPAISDGVVIVRTLDHVFGIGQK